MRGIDNTPTRVLVAGGGVAGLEVTLALRALAGERVSVELLAPEREFVYRALSVLEPFGAKTTRLDLTQMARDNGFTHLVDAVAEVDADHHRLITRGGDELYYDALVIATGAKAHDAIPGALTFGADVEGESFAVLIDELERGAVRNVVFALPAGTAWSLPLYELALNMASHLRKGDVSGFQLTIVTPEDSPLGVFGPKASEETRNLLEENGINLMTETQPVAVDADGMRVVPDGYVEADRVIALPRLEAMQLPGIPGDEAGFIPTDEYGRVRGVPNAYAAGDCTTFPVKQGGVAAAQADTVAEVIAARAGADVEPEPFRAVLRGMLLTGNEPRYLSARLTDGPVIESTMDDDPLWSPPTKIAARHLSRYLDVDSLDVDSQAVH